MAWSRRRAAQSALVFLASCLVYLLTRAPRLTWAHRGADGGDFLAAAATLGVPHPAGYPTYTLLLRLFMGLPASEPASAGSLLSAVMGAVAAALCFLIICSVLDRLAHGRGDRSWVSWAAVGGALSCAFVAPVWSQALVTEVYAFHLALVALAFWALLRWRRTGRGLPWVGLVAGLGLTNHLTFAFVGVSALAVVVGNWKKLRWRSLVAAGGACLVGLAPYVYIPWAARRLPPINWENAQDWDRFQRLVLAARYRHNVLEPTPQEVLTRVGEWVQALSPAVFWPLCLTLVIGLLWLVARDPVVGVATAVYGVLVGGYGAGYGTSDYWVNLLPAIMMLAVWLATGLWLGLRWLGRRQGGIVVGRLAVLALPLALLGCQWREMDIHRDRVAQDFVDQVLEVAAPGALIMTFGDQQTFGVWYGCYVLDRRPDLVPVLPTFLRSAWYRATLAANHEGLDLRPAGLGQEALQTMISRHLDQRPIYLTWEAEELSADYWLVQEGPLWRVLRPAAGVVP